MVPMFIGNATSLIMKSLSEDLTLHIYLTPCLIFESLEVNLLKGHNTIFSLTFS